MRGILRPHYWLQRKGKGEKSSEIPRVLAAFCGPEREEDGEYRAQNPKLTGAREPIVGQRFDENDSW